MSMTDMLLNRLKKINPSGYKFVMEVKNSGRNPNDVLKEMYQKGQINDSQLSQIQKQGRLFGVNIPTSEIANIRNEKNKVDKLPNQQSKSGSNNGFGGWF